MRSIGGDWRQRRDSVVSSLKGETERVEPNLVRAYSPEPWEVRFEDEDADGKKVKCLDVVGDGATIASIADSGSDEEALANAYLIAAAPQLLRCVLYMLEEYEEGANTPSYEIRELCREAKFLALMGPEDE